MQKGNFGGHYTFIFYQKYEEGLSIREDGNFFLEALETTKALRLVKDLNIDYYRGISSAG